MGGSASTQIGEVANDIYNSSKTVIDNETKNLVDAKIIENNTFKFQGKDMIGDFKAVQNNDATMSAQLNSSQQTASQVTDTMKNSLQNALEEVAKQSASGLDAILTSKTNKQTSAISNHIDNITDKEVTNSVINKANMEIEAGNTLSTTMIDTIGDVDVEQNNAASINYGSTVRNIVNNIASTYDGNAIKNSIAEKSIQKNASCGSFASCGMCCMVILIMVVGGGVAGSTGKSGKPNFSKPNFSKPNISKPNISKPNIKGGMKKLFGKSIFDINISDLFIALVISYLIYKIYIIYNA